ncbi:BAR domain-containing protein [Caenorhabditis elegans]|uniref:BAR domain-containing protein n=1 Tax=Caenorhabditis elegans TaxID=6239 RepID=Q95XA0_CAEEL|nr:BAR domain-containing protein [Caenorhabditis elegans]CCD66827.1 BAR domain-containing protein [Caenorhabditis elegans]|eukprot:NP_740918.2 Uncharacterized protein CELE_Y37F4.1 [Caenorhabditis elegans]
MANKKSTSSCYEKPIAQKLFYGLADHPNHGVFSSILKKKNRLFSMTDDVKKLCNQVEAYKEAADRLHQALIQMFVENQELMKADTNYQYAGQYLKTYQAINQKGRKLGTKVDPKEMDSLEPAIQTLLNLDSIQAKQVQRHLENLSALTKFIGVDYWEYARLRKIYWLSLETYDDAISQQNKERTEQAELAAGNAQTWRNECRQKVIDFINKSINEQKGKHADAVLKFRDDSILFHKSIAEAIPIFDDRALPKSKEKPLKSK